MWDYTVVIQGQDYVEGVWGDEHHHVDDIACDSLGEAIARLESVTPGQALEWERLAGCNGLDICVFADEVLDGGSYGMEFAIVAESQWVGGQRVSMGVGSWDVAVGDPAAQPHASQGSGVVSTWEPSDEKWDEGTICYGTKDEMIVVSAFPTSNDGGGYSVNIYEARPGVPAEGDSGQYFAYESLSDVAGDFVPQGSKAWLLLGFGCECESFDELCERARDLAGVDLPARIAAVKGVLSRQEAGSLRV